MRTPGELGTPRHTAPPEEMAHTVKAAARLYGAGLAGITPMNEAYVNLQASREDEKEKGKDIVFEDVDAPSVPDTGFVIPKKMKWVVVIAIPMDLDLLSRVPTALGDAASALGYSHSAFVVSSLAEFIRSLGYEAIPCVNDTAQSVPFALDAGIGELGRLNKLVTPEFGPRCVCVRFSPICKWPATSPSISALWSSARDARSALRPVLRVRCHLTTSRVSKPGVRGTIPDTKPGLRILRACLRSPE